jgi:hypothetical protein
MKANQYTAEQIIKILEQRNDHDHAHPPPDQPMLPGRGD